MDTRERRAVGGEIRALSNLMRRKILEFAPPPEDPEFTEMQGQLLDFLSHHPDREICQKDVEEAFCIRRSTASRLLKKLEAAGFITRRSVFRDARLKQVLLTPKAQKLHRQIEQRLDKMEELLTEGISDQELEQFMATVEKLKKNLS